MPVTAKRDGGDFGLLEDLGYAIAGHDRDAEVAEVLVLGDLGEHDARAGRLLLEVLGDRLQRPLEDVVGEQHAHLVARDEPLREPERVGDPARLFLVAVEEPVDAVVVAVAEQAEELAGVRSAGDEHQLVDAGADERFDGIGDHRPVVERQQVLVRDPRERMQPRARAAGEDDAFHPGECKRKQCQAPRCLAPEDRPLVDGQNEQEHRQARRRRRR